MESDFVQTSKRGSSNVQDLYGGPEGRLWELVAGEMLHCGGMVQSMTMANLAGIDAGQKVLDLCSGFGSSLRFLAKTFGIQGHGLELCAYMVDQANRRTQAEGLQDRIIYRQGSATQIPWRESTFDVVWGEDAWCYVEAKEKLIEEAARVLRPGGVIAFSDWMTGPRGLSEGEAQRIHGFLSFPNTESVSGYEALLGRNGMRVKSAENLCEQFARSMELYLRMIDEQLTYDALEILGGDEALLNHVREEWAFLIEMGRQGKFCQGRLVATKE